MGVSRRRARRALFAVTAAAAISAVLGRVDPASAQTWTGTSNGLWSVGSNWSSNPAVPVSGVDTALIFGPATFTNLTHNLANPFQLNSMTFNLGAPAYTIGGNAFDFRTGVVGTPQIVQNSDNALTFANAMTLTNNFAVTGTGNGQVTLNGAITGAGGLTLGNSSMQLVLGNAGNTFGGPVTVNAGVLALGNGAAIPTGRNITVNSGGIFSTAGLSNTAPTAVGTVTLNNGGVMRIPSGGGGNYYVNRLALGTGGALDFTGSASAAVHFVNAGAGISLSASANMIGAGTSQLLNDTATPLDINLGSGVATSNVRFGTGLAGQGFRFLGPSGIFVLNGTGSTGNLIVDNNAYLNVADMASLGSGTLTLANTSGLTLPGTLQYTGATASSSKAITLGANGGQIWVSNTGSNLTISGNITESVAGQRLLIAGDSSTPPGSTLTLSGVNSYTGPTVIGYGATLSVNSIPNGGVAGPLGASTSAPANLLISGHPAGGLGALQYTGATAATDRGVTLAFASSTDSTIAVTNAATNLTVSGQFTGPGNLVKTGAGTLTLANAGNNFTGGVRVEAGRLTMGSATALPAGKSVTINSGAEFNTGGFANTVPTALDVIAFNGGTLRAQGTGGGFHIHQLAIGASGGTIDATGSTGSSGLVIDGPGAITVSGNSDWSGPSTFYVGNNTGAELPISISPGVTVTSAVSLVSFSPPSNPFLITGGGKLHLTNPAAYVVGVTVSGGGTRLRMDNLTGVTPTSGFALTLDNGVLEYGGATASATGFGLGLGGGIVDVTNAATTLTLTGPINGGGASGLAKFGPGTLVLGNASNAITGSVTVSGGRLMLGAGTAIPAGGNVGVFLGSEFNTNGLGNSAGTAIGVVTLNNGTIRIPSGSAAYALNQLVIEGGGGGIDATGATTAGLVFTGAGAGITAKVNTSWVGPAHAYIGNSLEAALPVTISPGVTVTSSLSFSSFGSTGSNPFLVTGGGTLHLMNSFPYLAEMRVQQARLWMDNVFQVTGTAGGLFVTLDNGILQYSGPSVSASGFALGAGGGTVDVSSAGATLTFTGAIPGFGALTKAGPGTLNLNNTANSYVGGITVANGRLEVSNDDRLGVANPTVLPLGSLRFTASGSTSRTFNLFGGSLEGPSGGTLTLNGATVGGGFLRGSGVFALTGGANLTGATLVGSSTINQTGAASVTNFTNNGQFTNAAGQTLTWTDSTNGSAGHLTINGTANVSDFVSNGELTIPTGGTVNNNGSAMVLGGGSSTYVGSTATPGGAINLNGRNLDLRGALLVNQGTIAGGTINVFFGSLAAGTGDYGGATVVIHPGGAYTPGTTLANMPAPTPVITGAIRPLDPNQTTSAPVQLMADTVATVTASDQALTMTAALDGPGKTLTKLGEGRLALARVRAGGLTINEGTVQILPNGAAAGTSTVSAVQVSGRLDLSDNKLIVFAGDIGTFSGGGYTGLSGMIASSYNFGAWDGPGITTSMPDAGPTIGITTLAINTADETFYAGGNFGGVAVNSGDVLLMYSYAGDLNLDGLVDAADYGAIDNWIQFPGTSGYANGDFNYDGVIDAGDYGIIDNTIQLQGAPFPTGAGGGGGGGELSGVSAVPEPGGVIVLLAPAMMLLHRRRRGASRGDFCE